MVTTMPLVTISVTALGAACPRTDGAGQKQNRRACKHVKADCIYSCAVPLHVVEHPVVHDALATLRDASTPPEVFRRMAIRISLLLAAEATRDVPSEAVSVQTPLGPANGRRVGAGVVVVPVLRAGLGMLDAVLELLPNARVGHIGLQRDEMTAVASQYYSKLPQDLKGSFVLMIDPMLATGGSAVAALDLLEDRRRHRHPDDLHRRGARRHCPGRASSPQRAHLHARGGPGPERPQVHRARAG